MRQAARWGLADVEKLQLAEILLIACLRSFERLALLLSSPLVLPLLAGVLTHSVSATDRQRGDNTDGLCAGVAT